MTRDFVEAAIGGLDAANGTNFAEPTRKAFLLLAVAAAASDGKVSVEKEPPLSEFSTALQERAQA
jgi:tellurite resistance protein